MAKEWNWQHIIFIDGSSPYICRTKKEFDRIRERYLLTRAQEGRDVWFAKAAVIYVVYGFTADTEHFAYARAYQTKGGAVGAIKRLLSQGKYQQMELRKRIMNLATHFEIENTIKTYYPLSQGR